MYAAVVNGPNQAPVYEMFPDPTVGDGIEVVAVRAAAITNVTRARAAGTHYSSVGGFPLVPGLDGIGLDANGQRVMFMLPESPFGALAERVPVRRARCIAIPDGIDDLTAAAVINPGLSAVAALRDRGALQAGETVLVNGATGIAGGLAVQIAKRLGASRVIAVGRHTATLERLQGLGADVTISLNLEPDRLQSELSAQFTTGAGVDVVVDYLYGEPSEAVLAAIAGSYKGAKPIRYVLTGGATGRPLTLQPAMLASVPVTLLGSGIGSIPFDQTVRAAADAVAIAAGTELTIDYTVVPLHDIEAAWTRDYARSRVVVSIE